MSDCLASIRILGNGDSMGVPRVYCSCPICTEARTSGVNRRLRSSILLTTGDGELLIDCGPDWRTQMELLQKRSVGSILITHAHFDHIGGLPELADLCRWTDASSCLYAPGEVLAIIRRQFPWIEGRIRMEAIDECRELLGWRVIPIKVNHGKNGYSYAYRFERNNVSWAYCPDSIALGEGEKIRLKHLRLLLIGTSFYREEAAFHTRSVYDVVEALELVEEIKPCETLFTHMSHDIDLNMMPALPAGVRMARSLETILLLP